MAIVVITRYMVLLKSFSSGDIALLLFRHWRHYLLLQSFHSKEEAALLILNRCTLCKKYHFLLKLFT
ncbi:hypothetical protein [Bacillus sp. 2205SS5-2]|uniref:hypothetical protein n=1 Tax=Bacillus sp. 2205SS5-2 TaxID=3109031 RepID=UPI0030043A54